MDTRGSSRIFCLYAGASEETGGMRFCGFHRINQRAQERREVQVYL